MFFIDYFHFPSKIARGKKAVKPANAEDNDGSIHEDRVGEAERDWHRQIWLKQAQLGTL